MFTIKKIRKSPKFDSWPTAFGLILIFALGALIQSCSDINSSASEEIEIESYAMPTAAITGVNESDPVVINNFEIKFNGNTYDENSNTSTFSYTVSRGDDGTGFNYMKFEVPSCAELNEYSPLESSRLTDDGIEWANSIGANSSRDYIISYHGEVLTGMVDATIQASGSGDTETKLIPGPCKGVYTISGVVYVDENSNQNEDAGESGIENITVQLFKGETELSVINTSSTGLYSFNVYTGDIETDFSILVDSTSSASNKLLFENFSPTTNPPEVIATVTDKDVAGFKFGFKAETAKIIADFENETIKLRTETPSFWADEFKFSSKGKSTLFSKTVLLGFLTNIDGMDLKYKFDFGIGEDERIKKAEEILTVKGNSTDLEILLSEFLAALLNVASGNGAVDGDGEPIKEFNTLILKTGAAAAVASDPSFSSSLIMNSTTSETTTFTTTSSSTTDDSEDLLRSFNGGGGGVGN